MVAEMWTALGICGIVLAFSWWAAGKAVKYFDGEYDDKNN